MIIHDHTVISKKWTLWWGANNGSLFIIHKDFIGIENSLLRSMVSKTISSIVRFSSSFLCLLFHVFEYELQTCHLMHWLPQRLLHRLSHRLLWIAYRVRGQRWACCVSLFCRAMQTEQSWATWQTVCWTPQRLPMRLRPSTSKRKILRNNAKQFVRAGVRTLRERSREYLQGTLNLFRVRWSCERLFRGANLQTVFTCTFNRQSLTDRVQTLESYRRSLTARV